MVCPQCEVPCKRVGMNFFTPSVPKPTPRLLYISFSVFERDHDAYAMGLPVLSFQHDWSLRIIVRWDIFRCN